MKKLIYLVLTIVILTACSKEKTAEKRINGTWNLTSMKYYDLEGILHVPTCSGTFEVNESTSSATTYSMNIEFTFADSLFSEQSTGSISIIDKAAAMELSVNTTDTNFLQKQTILLLTKTDLRVEFFDPTGYKRVYTFLKN